MIEQVGVAHAAVLAAIHAASFPPGERWDEAALAQQLASPGVFALLHRAAGMVLARVAADEAEILTLAVVPAARGRGHGRALLLAAQAQAAAAGARNIFLEVGTANNAARGLYASCGYNTVGRRGGYYVDGSDALVLARALSRAEATGG